MTGKPALAQCVAPTPTGPERPDAGGVLRGHVLGRLRPEEAINLRLHDVIVPQLAEQDTLDDDGRDELHLRATTPDPGGEWANDWSTRERRQLKHRAEGGGPIVPVHSKLTTLPRFRGLKIRPTMAIQSSR